jgi:2-polyprenyl-6-hydroxyphenyl methylase/3-demethylubiquinone-9 3-methyltransferase
MTFSANGTMSSMPMDSKRDTYNFLLNDSFANYAHTRRRYKMNGGDSTKADEQHDRSLARTTSLDTSSHAEFYEYYAEESLTDEALGRLCHVRDVVITLAGANRLPRRMLVADVGCGAGTSSMLWAEAGHQVIGIDVNEPLIQLAKQRARKNHVNVAYRVSSATDLPLEDTSVDVCAAAELLEHVENWESCIAEFIRVLKPGGLLWMSTTNALCPIQHEFNLPLFSWYPKPLKAHYIHLAQSSRPELANYATYPAFNWFTPYGLKRYLTERGMTVMDRFDIANAYKPPGRARQLLRLIRALPPLRFAAHMLSPGTTVLAIKRESEGN